MNRNQLIKTIRERKSFLCVGLDTDMNKIPAHLLDEENPQLEFNRQIIDATKDFCVAYKINTAFYESCGVKGWEAMEQTVNYIGKNHLVIADAKRGDIGNTSKMYAKAFFELLNFDAITLSPYMGHDSIEPYLDFQGKWAILLALTSNPGAMDFEMLPTTFENKKLYEKVLIRSQKWGSENNMMYVVGATRGDLIVKCRALVPNHFLLVPGVGAQGGSLKEVAEYGMNSDCGLLVNSSRGIIYAGGNSTDFATVAKEKVQELQEEMKVLLKSVF